MFGKWKKFLITVACAVFSEAGGAQVGPATILQIDIDNYAAYVNDISDFSKLSSDPNATTSAIASKTFATLIGIADIVAVNGKPAKGTWTVKGTWMNLTPDAGPGQAIADTSRTFMIQSAWEIQQADGTPIGTIIGAGLAFGPPQPGAPQALLPAAAGATAITGGTGAFLGVRGQAGFSGINVGGRVARLPSTTEDPANRRARGGGARTWLLHLIPMTRPEVLMSANGPAVVHASDFTLVTTAKPARSGEVLTLFASSLGPTRPGVDPGQPFTTDLWQVANSPVELTVNGKQAEVLYAGGYPGAVDRYQVNFRVPEGMAPGLASIQLTSAWITGPDVKIAVQ